MLKIRSVEAIPLNASLRHTLRFGTVDRKQSQNVVVRITTEDGLVGYGEACPVPAFTRETQASITALIEGELQDVLVGVDALQRDPLLERLEDLLPDQPFALASIDIALWDLAGRALNVPVSTLLGGRFRERVDVHGSIGIGDAEEMVAQAQDQVGMGYRALKLYAGRDALDSDLARLRAVREAVGPDIAFILDINGLWDVETCLQALPALDELGVIALEQPLTPDDVAGQAQVTAAAPMGVAADEAVFTPADVVSIGMARTASVINLGLSKLGGLRRSRACATVAAAAGLGTLVGSVVELGIATAAGLHLAASLPELEYPTYLVGPLKYEQDIAAQPLELVDGTVAIPSGPGLGIEVDEEVLRRMDMRS